MKLHYIGLLAIGVFLSIGVLLAAEPPSVADLTKQLTGETPAAPRTPEQLAALYSQVLDALMPDMGAEDPGKRAGPSGTIERIAFQASRPGSEAERAACSKAIAARLGPDVAPLARAWLLRQLERIGRAEVVPQVAALLADKDPLVRESARRAIQKNSAKEASAALVAALGSADAPAWRIALVNALAMRRDPSSLGCLLKEAASDNDDVRSAAIGGLARLGDASAAPVIAAAMAKGSPAARRIATDCYFRLADAAACAGDKATALAIYKQMLGSGGHLKCAAIIGIGRAGTAADLSTLLEPLADQDARVRGACVEALCLLKGSEITAAIAAVARSPKPETRLAALQALARRGDAGTLPVFIAAAEDADEDVQAAAVAGLGRVGNATVVPLLLKAATAAGKPQQEAARQSLEALPGAEIDKMLLAAIDTGDVKVRAEVIHALAARHVVAATPGLLKAAADADAGVRSESLKALGIVAASDALAPLAALLAKSEDAGVRGEAANALVNIANRDTDIDNRSEPIVKALAVAPGPAKLSLLSVLGRIGGQTSLVCLRAAVKDDDAKIKDAAIRAMTEWPDVTAAEDLLAVANGAASPTHQVLALRGYLRVCCLRTDRPLPDAEKAKLLVTGLKCAKRPEEKRQALGGLAEVRDFRAFEAVVPCMDDPALKEEAASAAVRIGHDLWNRYPELVVAAMQKALEISKNDRIREDAKAALDNAVQKLRETKKK